MDDPTHLHWFRIPVEGKPEHWACACGFVVHDRETSKRVGRI